MQNETESFETFLVSERRLINTFFLCSRQHAGHRAALVCKYVPPYYRSKGQMLHKHFYLLSIRRSIYLFATRQTRYVIVSLICHCVILIRLQILFYVKNYILRDFKAP